MIIFKLNVGRYAPNYASQSIDLVSRRAKWHDFSCVGSNILYNIIDFNASFYRRPVSARRATKRA